MWDQGISIEAKYCILPTEKQNPKYVTVKNLSWRESVLATKDPFW